MRKEVTLVCAHSLGGQGSPQLITDGQEETATETSSRQIESRVSYQWSSGQQVTGRQKNTLRQGHVGGQRKTTNTGGDLASVDPTGLAAVDKVMGLLMVEQPAADNA